MKNRGSSGLAWSRGSGMVTLSSAVLALVRRDLDKVAPVPFGLPPRR
jgi:hypothetical protein